MEKENDKVKSIFEWHKIKIKIQLSEERKDMYFYEKDVWWASLIESRIIYNKTDPLSGVLGVKP